MDQGNIRQWNGVERRTEGRCRRQSEDRRVAGERRCDRRGGTTDRKRSLKSWVRTLTNPRLGVDRRRGIDQRSFSQRRDIKVNSLLTPEELADLLR